jgi:hypothetical protein
LLYCQIVDYHSWLGVHVGSELLRPLIVVSALWFAFEVWTRRNVLGTKGIIDASTFTVLGCATLILSRFYAITIFHVVAYHVVFWGFYPLIKLWDLRDGPSTLRYIGLNVLALACVTTITPISNFPWHLDQQGLDKLMIFTSIMHIMISFGSSRAQPEWIWRIFLPRPIGRVAPIMVASADDRELVAASK